MNTPVFDASISATEGGSCATPQSCTIKIQIDDDIRRFTLPVLAWEPLIKKTGEVYKLPPGRILLKYKDEEGDLITVSSTEDLIEAALHSTTRSLRLFGSLKQKKAPCKAVAATTGISDESKPKSVESPPNDQSVPIESLQSPEKLIEGEEKNQAQAPLSAADFKDQRKILREQRKLLREMKRGAKHDRKDLKKEVKRCMKAGSFEQVPLLEGQPPIKRVREGRACRFKDMTPEERAAHREARQKMRQAKLAAMEVELPSKPQEKEEDEVIASPLQPEEKVVTIADHLRHLKALGFSDVGRNLQLLQKHNGDINATLCELTA